MSTDSDLHNRWLDGNRVAGVRFLMNDYVEVRSGLHVGESGSVISIKQFESNVLYIVETESGKDIEVGEGEIEIAKS